MCLEMLEQGISLLQKNGDSSCPLSHSPAGGAAMPSHGSDWLCRGRVDAVLHSSSVPSAIIGVAAALPGERLSSGTWEQNAARAETVRTPHPPPPPVSPTRREIPEVTFLPFLRLLKSVQKCVLIAGLMRCFERPRVVKDRRRSFVP